MAFVVIYDASVLHPAPLRDLLVRAAEAGLVRARWTEEILDECFRSILARRTDLSAERLQRTRALMIEAVPGCLVTGYEGLVPNLELPDPDDRHVLAAAIRAHAQVIVTANLRDFPEEALEPFDIEARSPDDFVRNLIDLDPSVMARILRQQTGDLQAPPTSVDDVIRALEQAGLRDSAPVLGRLLE